MGWGGCCWYCDCDVVLVCFYWEFCLVEWGDDCVCVFCDWFVWYWCVGFVVGDFVVVDGVGDVFVVGCGDFGCWGVVCCVECVCDVKFFCVVIVYECEF